MHDKMVLHIVQDNKIFDSICSDVRIHRKSNHLLIRARRPPPKQPIPTSPELLRTYIEVSAVSGSRWNILVFVAIDFAYLQNITQLPSQV